VFLSVGDALRVKLAVLSTMVMLLAESLQTC
jgi:hypothetical protein